ncbi:MAG: sulfatase [Halieaceae bacterium]
MTLLRFLGQRLASLLGWLLLLAAILAAVAAYRIVSFQQDDDSDRMSDKANYLASLAGATGGAKASRPNIIFILFDDLGYGDIGAGAAGGNLISTPNIDRLAANGVTLSDFHSAAPVCSPARASYLTGRLPARAGVPNVLFPSGGLKNMLFSRVLNPDSNSRLPAEEITMAEVLSAVGYRTGMVGKWHLGDSSPSLPNEMGFDQFFGALYSNDQKPFAFYRNQDVTVSAPADQRQMSERYAQEAIRFVEDSAGQPFFLYFAHNFPHDPLFVRDTLAGKSDAGLFGDVMEEIDNDIGELVAALDKKGVLENTLIIISSDNGPWYLGDAGNLRGRKGSTFEGGMRVPFIAHWPAVIAGGRTEAAMAMGTDLLPTVMDILELPAPTDRLLDGKSIIGVLEDGEPSPHDYLYFLDGDQLFAVRDQRFKYRAPAGVHYGTDQMPIAFAVPQKEWLFDLAGDRRESYDTSDRHPQALQKLRKQFDAKQRELSGNLRGWDTSR